MSDGTPPTLTRVSWREVVPATLLLRVPGVAVDAGSVLLGTAAVWLLPAGWLFASLLFLPADFGSRRNATFPYEGATLLGATAGDPRSLLHSHATLLHSEVGFDSAFGPTQTSHWTGYPGTPPGKLAAGWETLFDLPPTLGTLAYLVFGVIWSAAVMALFGGSLARRSVVRLGTEQRVGLIDSVRYAARRFPASFTAPLLPILGVAPFAIVLALCGLAMRTDVGLTVGGVLWLVFLLIGFPMSIIAVGGLVGWPLMAARVVADDTDSFGAVSATYAYVFGRPWRAIVYTLIATAIGFAAIALFDWFVEVLLGLTGRAVSLGSSYERLGELTRDRDSVTATGYVVGVSLVRSTVIGFAFSYFWAAAAAIYLLLRLDVDHEEFDHVAFDEELRTIDPRRPEEPARVVGAADPGAAKAGLGGGPPDGATPGTPATPPPG